MTKKFIICLVLSTILIAIFFSLLTLLAISVGNLRQEQTSNDWIGFFGGLLGALIGCAITLYGLYVTRKDNKKELEENKKSAIIPFLSAIQYNGAVNRQVIEGAYVTDYICEHGICKRWILINSYNKVNEQHRSKYEEVSNEEYWFNTELIIKNIGNGPMLNLKVEINELTANETFSIGKDEVIKLHIYVKADLLKRDTNANYQRNKIVFTYYNIYGNGYKQSINFGIQKYKNILTDFDCISKQDPI